MPNYSNEVPEIGSEWTTPHLGNESAYRVVSHMCGDLGGVLFIKVLGDVRNQSIHEDMICTSVMQWNARVRLGLLVDTIKTKELTNG